MAIATAIAVQNNTLVLSGGWTIKSARRIASEMEAYAKAARPPCAALDLSGVTELDSMGALLVWQLAELHQPSPQLVGLSPQHEGLLNAVKAASHKPMPMMRHENDFYAHLVALGKAVTDLTQEAYRFTSFLGLVTLTLWRATLQPWRLRLKSTVHHMDDVGLKAMPIIGLLSLLIGVVISYQGADQLRQFGATVYVVNLLGISVLREIGVLMTAIIMAGRSGSAFTAQIGTMQVGQEVDALRTMGLSPAELLVAPRVIALTITLPLLTFYANMMALTGGALMCWLQLDIGPGAFVRQLRDAIDPWTLWVGLIKAPVFAFVIAVVGCYQGLSVSGSAESVGRLTTRAVVHAIFLVILLDALFSVLFAWLKI